MQKCSLAKSLCVNVLVYKKCVQKNLRVNVFGFVKQTCAHAKASVCKKVCLFAKASVYENVCVLTYLFVKKICVQKRLCVKVCVFV